MIEVKNVIKIYNESKQNETKAIDDISFKINSGELVAIMGKSGSGKTTLLNLISCLDRVSMGKIFLNGEDVSLKKDNELAKLRNENIGFIFQDFNLIPDLTIYENLSIVCYNKSDAERKELIHDALLSVGLENYEARYSYEMSGGQIQRVAIARALLKNSKILLLFEKSPYLR